MILIYDANAYLRQDLNRTDGVASLSPRFIYEAVNASPYPQVWVWDGPRNNERRRAIFPGYKIRDYTGQENIFAGLQIYRDLLSHSKAVQIEVPDYEADDVCATLARHYAGQGVPVVVHTNDFDFHQLTTNHLIRLKGVRPVEGVAPRHVSLYKALRGDSSDKIPGLPGFGIKSWEAFRDIYDLLNQAMSDRDVDTVLNQPWKPKQKAWLIENIDLIFDYYQITQMLDVPLDLIEEHTKVGVPDAASATQLLSRFML